MQSGIRIRPPAICHPPTALQYFNCGLKIKLIKNQKDIKRGAIAIAIATGTQAHPMAMALDLAAYGIGKLSDASKEVVLCIMGYDRTGEASPTESGYESRLGR